MPISIHPVRAYLNQLRTDPWAPRNRPRTITAATVVLWLVAWLDWAAWYLFPLPHGQG